MKKSASYILIVLFGLVFCFNFGVPAVQGMTSEDLLLFTPPMAGSASIVFTTEGSSFAPVITVSGNPLVRIDMMRPGSRTSRLAGAR